MNRPDVGRRGWRELVLVVLAFSALTVAMTSPLAFHLGEVGRVDNGDGQFSVWNVAWVARALVLDPRHVFDANIFFPRRGTLAYSESNLGAGALAIPVYWASGNAYAALNFALLASFVLSACGMYYLVRHLVADRRAAIVSAISFSYCPYLFGHLPHIQLLMTAGLPFGMLAFHRLTERPTTTRGAALGIVMALQAYFCGYYAVFSALLVGLAALVAAKTRQLWTNARYVAAMLVALVVAIVAALPVVNLYRAHQQATGFSRGLGDALRFSAVWRAYLSSPAHAHRWMGWDAGIGGREALFPGFVALIFGVIGAAHGLRRGGRIREAAVLYSGFALLAFWASFGPAAHLYSALYSMIPVFSFLRAPSRFGLVVDFSLSVLAGIGVAALLARARRPWIAGTAVAVIAIAELTVPLQFPPVPAVDEGYRMLATLPAGPLLELPVYSPQFAFGRERYMLSSTIHWMPLIDAYSDYIPPDFVEQADALASFPSLEAFAVLAPMHARYAVFHPEAYSDSARNALMDRLKGFAPYLRQRYAGDRLWVYEIVAFPFPA